MKINPRELREKGIKYCEEHQPEIGCQGCPLDKHSMCINDAGELSLQGAALDIIDFTKEFNKMVNVIYGEAAADEPN